MITVRNSGLICFVFLSLILVINLSYLFTNSFIAKTCLQLKVSPLLKLVDLGCQTLVRYIQEKVI
jgi:hypothetical protein